MRVVGERRTRSPSRVVPVLVVKVSLGARRTVAPSRDLLPLDGRQRVVGPPRLLLLDTLQRHRYGFGSERLVLELQSVSGRSELVLGRSLERGRSLALLAGWLSGEGGGRGRRGERELRVDDVFGLGDLVVVDVR